MVIITLQGHLNVIFVRLNKTFRLENSRNLNTTGKTLILLTFYVTFLFAFLFSINLKLSDIKFWTNLCPEV